MNVIEKLFGTHSERELKMIRPILAKIENLRPEMIAKSDEELRDQTRILKAKLADGATLDDILPEAFATVREAARRTLNMEHFPVQLIGGIVLHQGRIAEMRTGEGKTLVSTCPAYLNALKGKGVQIVTVNDYLAKRDAEWMGQVHRFLGLPACSRSPRPWCSTRWTPCPCSTSTARPSRRRLRSSTRRPPSSPSPPRKATAWTPGPSGWRTAFAPFSSDGLSAVGTKSTLRSANAPDLAPFPLSLTCESTLP